MPLHEERQKGLIYVVLYVDENLLVGTDKAMNDTICHLQECGIILKVYDDQDDYLSCEIIF